MRELYEGLGAFVVDGGEKFNPSIYDLLAAIHELPSEEVLVFPNNPNVVMAAERAAELSDKEARVVRCTSQQAGLAALVELDPAASIAENSERMDQALAGIRAGSVAPAARDDAKGRFVKGDAVGFVGDEIVAWGGAGSTLAETMARLAERAEIITVVSGEGAPISLRELEGHTPDGVELELHEGGQPHYWWLLAAQ
jgi:dihydroxyacetone kinase-like predicted kinase